MKLKNKKIAFLGDSITEGCATSCMEKTYWSLLAKDTGAVSYGYGIGGTRIAPQHTPSELSSYDRYYLTADTYVREGSFTAKSGYDMMMDLLDSSNLPTAVFAANDAIALGAMKAIKERGYKIPRDISIVGFNDEESSTFITPPLTTIHAPSYDMGQHGANLVYVASNLSIKRSQERRVGKECRSRWSPYH